MLCVKRLYNLVSKVDVKDPVQIRLFEYRKRFYNQRVVYSLVSQVLKENLMSNQDVTKEDPV